MSGKGLEVFACVYLGTNTRERMSVSRISGMVVWQLMFDFLGILN
jgi:hypothetical protein